MNGHPKSDRLLTTLAEAVAGSTTRSAGARSISARTGLGYDEALLLLRRLHRGDMVRVVGNDRILSSLRVFLTRRGAAARPLGRSADRPGEPHPPSGIRISQITL